MTDSFEVYKARAQKSSIFELKDRTFRYRLENDYNTEILAPYANVQNTFKAIVNMSTYNYSIESRILDYQKVDIPFEADVKVGDVLYWPRMKKNYIVFADRDTEKNYLLCYMSAADYEITWRDKNGIEHKQIASFLQTAKENIVTSSQQYDYLDASMQLLLKSTPATDALTYYDRIFIAGKNWKVVGRSINTFPGMVAIYLKEVPKNEFVDNDKTLPDGTEYNSTKVITSLDDVKEVTVGKNLVLQVGTLVNGNSIYDTYKVTTEGCALDYSTNTLTFPTKGTANITITSHQTGLVKNLTINVKSEEVAIPVTYSIEGKENVKVTLSYTYTVYKNVDGKKEPAKGASWSVNDSNVGLISETKDETGECKVHMGAEPGVLHLFCDIDGNHLEKVVTIDTLY